MTVSHTALHIWTCLGPLTVNALLLPRQGSNKQPLTEQTQGGVWSLMRKYFFRGAELKKCVAIMLELSVLLTRTAQSTYLPAYLAAIVALVGGRWCAYARGGA